LHLQVALKILKLFKSRGQMTFKIAHISDVHWESRDDGVSAELAAALKRESPNLLIFTGDLVDHPHHVSRAKPWLLDLCNACGISPEENLLVVPGNHDYRFWGNVGFLPLTARFFWKHFKLWRKCRIRIFPVTRHLDVTFLHIDSNPIFWGAARGRVGWWELRRVKRALQALPAREQLRVRNSLKVTLIHHHPLPIPYGGSDTFLFLTDAQRLLQFLAEQKVDMVLHGHKHRAPYSLVSLGNDRVIEVLGAGAAVKTSDYDPRGHNFNLICVEQDGLRYVRQFFCPPQGTFSEPPSYGYPAQSFSLAYEHAWKARGFRFRSLHWDMRIDSEGDRFNELVYSGLAVLEGADFSSLKPPPYEVDTGHLSGVWLNRAKTDVDVDLKEDADTKRPRHIQFEVLFQNRPTEEKPARFAVQSWDLNACALNLSEFDKKFPSRRPRREWEEKRIRTAIDDFYWMISFPPELVFRDSPRFEVVDPLTERTHEWLTKILQASFYYSATLHTAVLSVHKPPGDFLYRIYWYVGQAAVQPSSKAPLLKPHVDRFARDLLNIARERKAGLAQSASDKLSALNKVLRALAQLIAEKIAEILKKPGLVKTELIDVSLMVDDDALPPQSPMLRIVAATGEKSENFWDFTLEEGDGNAGRAYKRNILRCFDSKIPDPKRHTYVLIPDYPQHEILYSMPLRHPEDNALIYGILNVGSFERHQANLLRSLNTDEGNLWLLETAQKYILPRLLNLD